MISGVRCESGECRAYRGNTVSRNRTGSSGNRGSIGYRQSVIEGNRRACPVGVDGPVEGRTGCCNARSCECHDGRGERGGCKGHVGAVAGSAGIDAIHPVMIGRSGDETANSGADCRC